MQESAAILIDLQNGFIGGDSPCVFFLKARDSSEADSANVRYATNRMLPGAHGATSHRLQEPEVPKPLPA